MNEQEIFLQALALPAEARSIYLEQACADDPVLKAAVAALLRAHQGASAFLENPAVEPSVTKAQGSTGVELGKRIGPYKLVELIGEGGMGSVYLAQQTEPVKRVVAIKVIKAGMDSKAVLGRFDAERQALAMMDHPNIARVLDAGATIGGRPYFVMELVKGLPITRFCDERRLTLRQRLELFVPVCHAIQHAHQKGVIHRDIKPSNVLIALYDDRPVSKVIDFGVAKATGSALTDQSLMTGFGAVVGTAEYMSPEQATLNNLDVDTRSDVYSLGVLLYELLTGTTPIDRKSLGKTALMEILRIVREVEAPVPSVKLSTADTLPSVAANRSVEPSKLSGLLKGELDWVLLKALEKDRTRRYETANAFARDLQRYLSDEMVEARPPSVAYKVTKFVRRNKGQVLAASLILLALVGGVIGTSWGMVEARRATTAEAEAKKRESERAEGEKAAKLDAQSQKETAVKRLTQVEKGNEILTSVFRDLNVRALKGSGLPLEAILAKRLARAGAQLEEDSVGDATVLVKMQNELGLSLSSLGFEPEAAALFEKAYSTAKSKLGPDDEQTLASMRYVAAGLRSAGKFDRAVALFEEALQRTEAKFGRDHPSTVDLMNGLALALESAGKLNEASVLLEKSLARGKSLLGPDHPLTLITMHNQAMVFVTSRKLDRALPLYEETLKRRITKLGADHPDTLSTMNNLAHALSAAGDVDRALSLYEEAFKLRKARLGLEHPSVLQSLANLTAECVNAGKADRALPILEETLNLQKETPGPDHPNTFKTMFLLGNALQRAGKPDRALPLLEETLRLQKAKLGPDHPDTLGSMNSVAACYCEAGKLEMALPIFEETLKLLKARLGADHPRTLDVMNNMAMTYLDLKQPEKAILAERLMRECLALSEKKRPNDLRTFDTRSLLGRALLAQKKYAEAEPFLVKYYEWWKQRERSSPAPRANDQLPEALDQLVELYTAMNKPEELKKWKAERAKYDKPSPAPPAKK